MKGVPVNEYQFDAKNLLLKVLETQPNIVERQGGRLTGSEAAQFCIDFINTYSYWLMKNQKS